MKIETKIHLISQFQITPSEIKLLLDLNLPIDYNAIVKNSDYQILIKSFEDIIDNRNLDEDNLLDLVYINTKIKGISIEFSKNPEDEYEDLYLKESPEVQEYDKEIEYNWAERRKVQKNAIAKYKQYSQQEIDKLLFEYVWNKYPQIRNGFDRSIYSKAKYTFTDHIGIYATFEAPESLRVKLNNAEENAKSLIIEKFKKLEVIKFEEWLDEYRKWLNKADVTKSTKTNIKEFFKEIGIKASDITIGKIKSNY